LPKSQKKKSRREGREEKIEKISLSDRDRIGVWPMNYNNNSLRCVFTFLLTVFFVSLQYLSWFRHVHLLAFKNIYFFLDIILIFERLIFWMISCPYSSYDFIKTWNIPLKFTNKKKFSEEFMTLLMIKWLCYLEMRCWYRSAK
jgi:hypothetical protein